MYGVTLEPDPSLSRLSPGRQHLELSQTHLAQGEQDVGTVRVVDKFGNDDTSLFAVEVDDDTSFQLVTTVGATKLRMTSRAVYDPDDADSNQFNVTITATLKEQQQDGASPIMAPKEFTISVRRTKILSRCNIYVPLAQPE